MKKFVMEFFSRILLGIVVAAFVFLYCKSKISLSGALGILILFLILWGYYCRSILLLIFDVLKGPKTEIVYFNQMRTVRRCQIFSWQYYTIWQFYTSNQAILCLVNPQILKIEDVFKNLPSSNQKMHVEYYRLSKIIKSYKIL